MQNGWALQAGTSHFLGQRLQRSRHPESSRFAALIRLQEFVDAVVLFLLAAASIGDRAIPALDQCSNCYSTLLGEQHT